MFASSSYWRAVCNRCGVRVRNCRDTHQGGRHESASCRSLSLGSRTGAKSLVLPPARPIHRRKQHDVTLRLPAVCPARPSLRCLSPQRRLLSTTSVSTTIANTSTRPSSVLGIFDLICQNRVLTRTQARVLHPSLLRTYHHHALRSKYPAVAICARLPAPAQVPRTPSAHEVSSHRSG